jgi:hypothetical protein
MRVRPPRAFAALLVLAALLALPALAAAAPVQFGSPLTPGPSGAFGCELRPFQTNSPQYGDWGLFQNTQTNDCTWRQSGVWGSETDSRVSSVPGDGRIVRAEVLSGANPAPIRITVIRQLNAPGFPGQCCFYVSETAPIALTPNAVTTIPLDLAVERNTLKGILAVDLMSISADKGAGSLPLRIVGPSNTLTQPNGTVMASSFYPRMGQIPNDAGGGRRETEAPAGVEVMVRWTWCATGDASCQPAPLGTPPTTTTAPPAIPTAGALLPPKLGATQAQVREGNALVGLVCGTDAACQGKLELLAAANSAGARAAAAKPKAKAKTVVFGSASYKLAAGAKGTVSVKLNRRGKAALKKKGKLGVTLKLAPKGGTATTQKLTLKSAPAKAPR